MLLFSNIFVTACCLVSYAFTWVILLNSCPQMGSNLGSYFCNGKIGRTPFCCSYKQMILNLSSFELKPMQILLGICDKPLVVQKFKRYLLLQYLSTFQCNSKPNSFFYEQSRLLFVV
jgi:hypothetical protein